MFGFNEYLLENIFSEKNSISAKILYTYRKKGFNMKFNYTLGDKRSVNNIRCLIKTLSNTRASFCLLA